MYYVSVEKVARPKLAQGVVDDGESDDDGQDKAESEQSDINDDDTEKRVDSRASTPEVDGRKDEPAVVEVERDPEPVARPGSLVCIDLVCIIPPLPPPPPPPPVRWR